MLESDILFCGSDGKDDLIVGIDQKGNKIINENTDLILDTIEDGKGNLEKIYQILISKGELYDDLSLIKIEYKKED